MTHLVQPVAQVRARTRLGTAAAALALAMTASGLLLWGRSYPGFPMSAVALAILAALIALVLPISVRPRGASTTAMLLAVTLVLMAGVATTVLIGDALLRARWSRSASAFSAEVESLGPPSAVESSDNNSSWGHVSSPCPTGLGAISLSECLTVDRGYLFLQAPNAITDSSGIAYLPEGNNPATTQLSPHDLTPLGGPWWSWTCHC